MFQSILAGVITFVLTVMAMPYFIRYIKLKKIGGQQMHEDVKQHLEKAGTPTLGGVVFLCASTVVILLATLLMQGKSGGPMGVTYGILLVLVIYGAIGFLDDFLKIFKQVNEGLTSSQKFIAQVIGGVLFYLIHVWPSGTDTLNLFGYQLHLGVFYIGFVLFWLVGFSNAVNLTDGIDGLASISVVISLATYGVIAVAQKQFDVLLIVLTLIGGLLGFFVYNHKPAKVFMGDVGSLALGAILACLSIALHQEWTLLLVGLVYVIETSSVMLQVTYFKWTKKRYGEGRRIFRMTPFHHHLELGGLTGKGDTWSEWKVDAFLWTVGLISNAIVLLILY